MTPSWGALLGLGVLSRLLVLVAGYLAGAHLPPLPLIEIAHAAGPQTLVQTFYRWDAAFYVTISQSGYSYSPGSQCTAAFMPLLPALMAAATLWGVDRYLAGLVIANLAFALGLMVFGRAILLTTKNAATTWKACALLCAFPTAFFYSCPYQESLAFLGVSLAWWAWLQEKPGLAAGGILFAGLARLTALAFPAALLLEWCANAVRSKPNRSLLSIIAIGLAGLLAVGLFCLYLRHNVGDGLAHLKAHAAWDRKPPSPANIPAALAILFYDYPVQDRWHSFWMGATSLLLFLGLGLRALRVRGVFAASMILLPILQALLTGTPMSLERIVLASSLAFLDLAEILKRPWLFWSCLAGFSTMQLWLLNGYVHFQFMG